eukprot:6176653-Pleurochrysis_carterae.AAC.3
MSSSVPHSISKIEDALRTHCTFELITCGSHSSMNITILVNRIIHQADVSYVMTVCVVIHEQQQYDHHHTTCASWSTFSRAVCKE